MTLLQCVILATVLILAAIIAVLAAVEFAALVLRMTGRHHAAERMRARLEPWLRLLWIVR